MKPLILALDTTGAHGSLALVRGGEVIEEVALDSPDGFAHVIYAHIEGILRRNGQDLKAVDAYAAAAGPGSFTGVRVGLSCVKGLAEATSKPVYGVSNLRALAWFGTGALRAALIDARRGEVYGAVYDAAGNTVIGETVGPFDGWVESLPGGDVDFIAQHGFEPGSRESQNVDQKNATVRRTLQHAPGAISRAIADIARERYLAGDIGDPSALDANYVRRSDAELFWKE